MKRYPLQKLLELTGIPPNQLRQRVGQSGAGWKAWMEQGAPEDKADRCAKACGIPAFLVWDDWLDDVGKICEECSALFVPVLWNARFCGSRCQRRQWRRNRWANDPEFAAKERARTAKWKEETGDYEARQARARYWANPEARREYQRELRKNKAEHLKAVRRARYLKNRDKILAQNREYKARKREAKRAMLGPGWEETAA